MYSAGQGLSGKVILLKLLFFLLPFVMESLE